MDVERVRDDGSAAAAAAAADTPGAGDEVDDGVNEASVDGGSWLADPAAGLDAAADEFAFPWACKAREIEG